MVSVGAEHPKLTSGLRNICTYIYVHDTCTYMHLHLYHGRKSAHEYRGKLEEALHQGRGGWVGLVLKGTGTQGEAQNHLTCL